MKVLIVDDSPTNRKLLRITLEAEGHSTIEAGDGVEALDLLGRESADAVISDILMPNMDGYRLCHELRHNEKIKHIAFLHYTSTYTSPGDKQLSESFGADRYLTKPVSSQRLLEALEDAVSRSTERKSSSAKACDSNFVMKQYSQALVNKLEKRSAELEHTQADLYRTNQALARHADEVGAFNAELERRIHERTTELEKANEQLNCKQEEMQRFYHTLSHELKTPLTSASEFVALVIDGLAGSVNETQLEYLGMALDSCKQLHLCINDLLDASRLDTGKLSIAVKTGSLPALVKRVVASFQTSTSVKGIALRYNAQDDLPGIPFDARRMTQVITNLINNALKFTEPGGAVAVEVGQAHDQPEFVSVSVTDTGRGIPSVDLSRIFDRLYQIKDGDATKEAGFGLGLYLCRELVQLHGGRIWAESKAGQGSVLTFLLPKRFPEELGSVLLVDDDPGVREVLSRVLEQAAFSVVATDSGPGSLKLAEQPRPDVVLLDLQMPDVDGAEVLALLRKRWGAIPVIVLTGFPDSELMHRALASGPFTLLAKPCEPDELLATIRRVRKQEETTFFRTNRDGCHTEPLVSTAPGSEPSDGDATESVTHEENHSGGGRRRESPHRPVAAA